jgi:hypothetical protein
MLLIVSIPIGLTFGAATWSLIRGRGGFAGLALSMLLGVLTAFVGGLAGQALFGASPAAVGLGALAGGLLSAVVEAVGWGPRPKPEGHGRRYVR